MCRATTRGFQYFVVNSQGLTCGRPHETQAQIAADRRNRNGSRGY
jgi:hypothetical protein